MKTTILAFLVALFPIGKIHGDPYPISPRPLRILIAESAYIITGHVTEIKKVPRKENKTTYTDHYAIITIMDVLQGNISETEINVGFNPNMICPAPPFYREGTTVVVFLNKHEDKYYTHALSYGAKTVTASGLEAYRSRIREMQQISKMSEGLEKFMATVEWLVTCAEHSETRWEGSYELSPDSDFMSYYSRTEHLPFSSMLSPEQRERLKQTLLTEKEMGNVDFGLVDLVYVGNEKEIHEYLLNALKNISGSGYYFAIGLMERLKLLTNDPALDKLIEKYDAICWDVKKEDTKKEIIAEFVTLLEK
jgi:hypothetical protein